MADKPWKRNERKAAALFGSKRNSLSGGNSKLSRSDSIHPRLFLECKQAKRHAVWTLYDEVRPKARKEKKIPVVVLRRNRSPGMLLCIHSDHIETVLKELLHAQKCKEPLSLPVERTQEPQKKRKKKVRSPHR